MSEASEANDNDAALVTLRKTSLVDFPGRVSAVIFFMGCNLRCPWCQNAALLQGKPPAGSMTLTRALAVIKRRSALITGVVLSGGEPTLFQNLHILIRDLKNLSLAVKLDTNGLRPDVLEALFKTRETCPDYIAMDLKLAPERYTLLQAADNPGMAQALSEAVRRSAALIRASGVPHEFRSLRLPASVFTEHDKAALSSLVQGSPWVFRPFIPGNCLDPAWNEAPYA